MNFSRSEERGQNLPPSVENGAAVDSVMIGGRLVLDRGRLTTIDEKKLRRDATSAAERLAIANEPTRRFSQSLQQVVGTFCRALSCEPYHIHRQAWDAVT